MRLYDYARSSSAWRVRIALEHKGIEAERVIVDVSVDAREQDRPEYAEVNPMRQVPVLEWTDEAGTHRLTQSVAILEYLEQRYPSPPLLPAEPTARAFVRELVQLVNAGIQPLQNNRVVARVDRLGADGGAWAAHHIARGLEALEALARVRARTYLAGDELTLADVLLVPQLYNARWRGVDLEPFPTLVRVDQACAELPAFVRAHPEAVSG